jgi:ABC-2 type transport system ATP-binding protein
MRILELGEGSSGAELRSRIGYMPERDAHVAGATGFEMVALLGRLSGMPRRAAWRRAHEALYLVGLEEQRYRAVSTYSLGMRQKAKLAAALVHDPEVLFLDEPTNGLDPAGREEMLALIDRLGREQGKSIVLSTHILQDVESVCDAVVVLDAGRVVSQGAIAELTASAERRFAFAVEPVGLELPAELAPGIRIERAGQGRFVAWLTADSDSRVVFRAVGERGGAVRRFGAARRTLEEVFFGAVGERFASAGGDDRLVGDGNGPRADEVWP